MALAPYGPDSVEAGPVHLLKDELLPFTLWLHPTPPVEALTHRCGTRCSTNLWMAMARFLNCRLG